MSLGFDLNVEKAVSSQGHVWMLAQIIAYLKTRWELHFLGDAGACLVEDKQIIARAYSIIVISDGAIAFVFSVNHWLSKTTI